LEKCFNHPDKFILKPDFYIFYGISEFGKNKKKYLDIIHCSLENLVSKDLINTFGKKTKEKWFIEKVSLTSKGKIIAKEMIKNRQKKLPLK
jgi:hypothetical protein